MEQWKDIKGYENLYQVSDLGRIKKNTIVKSSSRNGGARTTPEKILKPNIKRNGYLTVDLCKDGIYKTISIHRLVLLTFRPIPNPKEMEIDHINTIKTDNRLSNLEWVTPRENKDRAKENHLYYSNRKKQVRCKQLNMIFESSYIAAEYLNNHYFKNTKIVKNIAGKIRACALGHQKIAYGFTWEYIDGSTTNS